MLTRENNSIPAVRGDLLGESYLGAQGVRRAIRIDSGRPNHNDGQHEASIARGRVLLGGNPLPENSLEDRRYSGHGDSDPPDNSHERSGSFDQRGCKQIQRRVDAEEKRSVHHSLYRKVGCFALLASALVFSGCAWFGAGRITSGGTTVQGVKDAGSPATIAKSDAGVSVALPQGSEVVVTKSEAIPATDKTPAVPAKEITSIRPNGPSEYHQTESKTAASTGTIDQSVALKKVEAAEDRILLYGALGLAVAGGIFFWLKYPSPALMCWAGAGISFLAWKVSGLPSWFWGLSVLAAGGGVGLYFGHNRGLYEPVPETKLPDKP